ncbi:R-SNARE 1 [Giardia duodenalis]|uniref:Vesicle-trafficking protein SEC22b n=2 Tax=Giardia intestinalis TaxID=5741 RepID=A0A644F5E3_GIAIC|nr:R-SNARE 1 [Giardia intestinalis]KAE8303827.1 R-SNARE 1 [Giardia intestinalis]
MNAILIGRLNGAVVLCYKELKPAAAANLGAHMRGVLEQLTPGSPPRQSYSDEGINIHYSILSGVVYMAAAGKGVSVTAAMSFLQSMAGLFSVKFSPNTISVATSEAPFSSFIPEIEKLARDADTRSAMLQLQTETQEIKSQVMQSVESILNRGNKLSDIETQAADLLTRAKDIMGDAQQMNREAFWRQYSVFIVIGAIVVLFILLKIFFR